MARGYKLHAIYDPFQGFVQWKIKPMNANEGPVAAELIRPVSEQGYLIGDNAYDRNKLYDLAGGQGIQLIEKKQSL